MVDQSSADRAAVDADSAVGSSSSDTDGVPRVTFRALFRGFETRQTKKK
jgi:hypothetical protein